MNNIQYMAELKYKVGDRVRIKSSNWYNQMLAIKDKQAYRTASNGCELIGVWCGNRIFKNDMIKFCGQVMTIKAIENEYYIMHEDTSGYWYCDEMIEGLVEEETQPKFKVGDRVITNKGYIGKFEGWVSDYQVRVLFEESGCNVVIHPKDLKLAEEETKPKYEDEVNGEHYSAPKYLVRPSGYQFVDENGNVINATKIVLEKKKKKYPKTFEECVHVLEGENRMPLEQMNTFRKLIDARNAYWKIAGEEMGLGKPWENGRCEVVYGICRDYDDIVKQNDCWGGAHIFEFPIREMRDAFYENFKEEIEICKEFL